jgi:O-antigen ligase
VEKINHLLARNKTWALFFIIVLLAPLSAFARNGMALMPFVLAAIIYFRYGFSGLFDFDKFIFIPTFLLFAWGLSSAIWSDFPDLSKAPALALTAFTGAVVALAPKKMSDGDIKQYARAICYLGIASAIVFSFQFAFDFPVLHLVAQSYSGGTGHGNITPIVLLIFPIGVAMFLERRNKIPGFMFVGIMLIVVTVGPMFAAAVAVYVASILFISSYYFPKSTIAVFFSILISYFIFSPILHKDFVTIEYANRLPITLHGSWIHRLGIWTFAAEAAVEHPILGVGLRGSRHLGQGQVIEGTDLPLMTLHPHNAALQVWLELGLVGVFLVIAICLGMARLLWRMRHERLLLAMSCASFGTFAMISLLSFGIWQTWWHGTIWVTAFIISLVGRRLTLEKDGPARTQAT